MQLHFLLTRYMDAPSQDQYSGKGNQNRHCMKLLHLPLPALALIYHHCGCEGRKALLGVSAGCRDWVLRETRSIALKLPTVTAARKPLARLLNRACNLADRSLGLCLDFRRGGHKKSRLLADLLEPGIQQYGWISVAKLVLKGPLGTGTPAKLLSAAVPLLKRLELVQVPLTWRELHPLTSCSQLSCLLVDECVLPETALATNPLAALTSLTELHVHHTTSTIAQGLTQLTSLCLQSRRECMSCLLMHRLQGMQQLQQLEFMCADAELFATQVAQLFSATPHLKGLGLGNTIRQPAFDALLEQGTQLTRLTCQCLQLSEDRSQSACSWKELVVTGDSCVPRTLALLPLHSLSRVCLGAHLAQSYKFEIPSACPSLRCCLTPIHPGISSECTPAEVHAALANLTTCPAWQATEPSVHVRLFSRGHQQSVQEWMQSFPALAALAGRRVQLSIDAGGCKMAADIVEHLEATFGASLTHLTLLACSIPHDFWPAVWRHLPGLQQLSIWRDVTGAVWLK